ncbi:putative transcription factor NAM family [Rosa chinensis]|uniref:Putative transcription factor NAM family n=1 Tax=Rosa chinensis TaxID=74649 RepID=A0A2P6R2K5_ROSCH|nr:NAC domain-containing protein 41 [Rosa chinensis]XP_040375110.1 NAC domain-containing protein 41 [Rosa chinensis]PRQ40670.1 putative transcription factor NAM family [Rosa chinensis]
MLSWVFIIVFMAFSPSASKKKGDFDLLKCSKVDVGKKEKELKLPTGYRFSPDDDELVLFYLVNKILGRTLPITDVIKEIDLYENDPDQLPLDDYRHGTKCNEAYYFTNVEQIYSSEGKVTKRTTKGGYWKVTSEGKQVIYGDDKVVVGFKTSMLFNKGHVPAPKGSISSFVMHEYRVNPSIVPVDVLNDSIRAKIERFVVCKIVSKEARPAYKLPPELLSHGEDAKSN